MDAETALIVREIRDSQIRMETKMENFQRVVLGNGQPGLQQRVEKLENSNARTVGVNSVISGVFGVCVEYFAHRWFR